MPATTPTRSTRWVKREWWRWRNASGGDVPGLRLSGVRAGSPADAGGLRTGDRVTSVFLRIGEQLTTSVTLGTRGQ